MSSTTPMREAKAETLQFDEEHLTVRLTDGRELRVPLAFYPSLLNALPEAREAFVPLGDGDGFEWPELELFLSTQGFLDGTPERTLPGRVKERWSAEGAALARQRGATIDPPDVKTS